MKQVALFDIDGTLSDPSRRLHYIKGEKKDYNSFYNEVYFDSATSVVNLVRELQKGGTVIICVTGRPESCRFDTQNWLTLHGIFPYKLLMRKDGDYREDSIIKEEILKSLSSED